MNFATTIIENQQQFAEQGYLVVRGLLNIKETIDPFKEAYIGYLDTLAEIFLRRTSPVLLAEYPGRSFPERFAILLGVSGGRVLQHLDPSLRVLEPDYLLQKDRPSAQRPELFNLMRNDFLLATLEGLLGPEISASPIYHFNLKLALAQLKLAQRVAASAGHHTFSGGR
jgi:hypothetical protein